MVTVGSNVMAVRPHTEVHRCRSARSGGGRLGEDMRAGPDAEQAPCAHDHAPQAEVAGICHWQRWFWPCLVVVLVLDQLTKSWLFQQPIQAPYSASNPGSINGFPEWIERSFNTGVAWGVLHRWPLAVACLTLVLVPVLSVVWWRFFRLAGRIENIALGAILGGALGNGIDRFQAICGMLHGVRDFIMVDLHPIGIKYIWPTFNIADAGISVGFVLLAAIAVGKPKPVLPDRHAHVLV